MKTRTTPVPPSDDGEMHLVRMKEWEQRGPRNDPGLRGTSLADDAQARKLAEVLRQRLDIRPGYDGLEMTSTSFVGWVEVGRLRIAIEPKLPAMPLTRLLRYAYGLRDVATIEEAVAPTVENGFHELLIAMLVEEVRELLQCGLARRYAPIVEKLESPRGRIQINQLAREGGVREARLPCRHFERSADWHLNRVLRAGVDLAAALAVDHNLRRRAHQLTTMFGDVQPLASLTTADIDRAERELTRLTDVSKSALTIIRLLHEGLGLDFDGAEQSARIPGFLFDMNAFFQRLLSRFLHDHLKSSHIIDELPIHELFTLADTKPGRRVPRPRPDYALLRGEKIVGFLDAKYRDIWSKGLPAEWLYQLTIYALASPKNSVSVLLYASMAEAACDERIEIRLPPASRSGVGGTACVVLRPVPLRRLAELLDLAQFDAFGDCNLFCVTGFH